MKMQWIALFLFLLATSSASAQFDAKQRVDLDDVQIRGEVQNQGISVLSKTKNSLDGRIKVRVDFKGELNDELPPYFSTESKGRR